ncbi:hypothetical protein [Rhodococcoides yunnanense]|uniref:hypothetical protein n=1 Tax=Rhodococcoides yunnanense TaxID=278209 RepID=UPI00157C9933|nr:hypothetical protein [Rhodococcus yunnanensis]
MEMRTRLMVLAASLVAFNAALWSIPKIAPEAPGRWEGVQPAAPPTASASTTPPPPLPADFPSMERPPPTIAVPEGQPQPIATKFGLTYDIPADWENWYDGVAGWNLTDGSSVTYGAIGYYDRTECHDGEYSALAMTGMSGRRTGDLDVIARAEVEKTASIYSHDTGSERPSVTIDGPIAFSIEGRPAVRYRAIIEDIPLDEESCTPPEATFDVVTTPGYATAEVALFAIRADRGVDNALPDAEIDGVISSIRRS